MRRASTETTGNNREDIQSYGRLVNLAEQIIVNERGQDEFLSIKRRQNRDIENAGVDRMTKMTDGETLLAKAPNIPRHDVANDVRSSRDAQSSVVGVGFAALSTSNNLPISDFFTEGRVFAIRVKHSRFPASPGQGSDVGSKASYLTMSLKFSDHDFDSPLDLVMTTGRHGPYYNVTTMDQFHAALRTGHPDFKDYLLSTPVGLISLLDGLRYEPDSYTDQHYYTHQVYEFKAADGRRRLARFRVTPSDRHAKQSGLLTPQQQQNIWNYMTGQLPECISSRPESHLRSDFLQRLSAEGSSIQYDLDIQLFNVDEITSDGGRNASNLTAQNLERSVSRDEKQPQRSGSVSTSFVDVVDTTRRSLFNPCQLWPNHPWIPLARVTVVSALTEQPVTSTSFSVGRFPASTLSVPDPFDVEDFCSVAAVESRLASMMAAASSSDVATDESQSDVGATVVDSGSSGLMTDYLIHCVTGSSANAGTSANVFISIVGSKGRTPYMKLQHQTRSNLVRNTRQTFVLQERPVGTVRYVQIYNQGSSLQQPEAGNWFLAYVVVITPYNGRCFTMPFYRWLCSRSVVTLRDGAALIKSREVDQLTSLLRDLEISDRQQQIKLRSTSRDSVLAMPRWLSAGNDVNALPVDLLTDETRAASKVWSEFKLEKSLLKTLAKIFSSRKGSFTAEFEKSLADTIQQKYQNNKQLVYVIRHWREDEQFALQLFNGTHPSLISRVKDRLPPAFSDLTDLMVCDDLLPGKTLQDELEAGNLYVISYSDLTSFAQLSSTEDPVSPTAKKSKLPAVRYISAPSVLFCLQKDQNERKPGTRLVPLAIRLNPSETSPIFTRTRDSGAPKDRYSTWLLAKMWVRTADVHRNLLGSLVTSRLLMETVATSLFRSLPAVHPVYKLLAPHLIDAPGLNTVYRRHVVDLQPFDVESQPPLSPGGKGCNGGYLSTVLAPGERSALTKGLCAQYVSERLSSMTFESFNVRKQFERLDFLHAEVPVGYWNLADSVAWWDAIWCFVDEILSMYYRNSTEVSNDVEVLAMLNEMHQYSLSPLCSRDKFESLEELTEFVTVVIFTCSVHQTSLQRAMVDVYSYCPNAPPFMMVAPPSDRNPNGYTEQQMREMLPSQDHVEQFIGVVSALAGNDQPAKVAISDYPDKLFTEEAPLMAIERFRSRLRQISDDIQHRNNSWPCPYDYLLPRNVYQGFST